MVSNAWYLSATSSEGCSPLTETSNRLMSPSNTWMASDTALCQLTFGMNSINLQSGYSVWWITRPEEPGELFYRLNQLTNLTAAEQRNAFFGPVRKQIKDLVQLIKTRPDFERRIGFSNARMSYDDVLVV